MSTYFKHVKNSVQTLSNGLKLTLEHLWDARRSREPIGIDDSRYFDQDTGIVTLQYPYETLPVPDIGRYRLHNEMEDCIVCDKCAKICPVNCIDIEPIRAVEEIGKTSDGTPKRIHAAKFDIDMAKCCFCGLCTTVCPTECLTMTKVYDFSEYDVRNHNYEFAEMTPLEILEARQTFEESEKKKAEMAKEKATAAPSGEGQPKPRPKVMAKPRIAPKPKIVPKPTDEPKSQEGDQPEKPAKPRPVFKPRPIIKKKPDKEE